MVGNSHKLDMDRVYTIMGEKGYIRGPPAFNEGTSTIPLFKIGADEPTGHLVFSKSERYLVRVPGSSDSDYNSLCRDFTAAVSEANGKTTTTLNLDELAEMFDRRMPISPLGDSFIGR